MALELIPTWDPLGDDFAVIISATRWVSKGRSRPGSFKFLATGPANDLSGIDQGPAYEELFGEPPVGSKLWVKIVAVFIGAGLEGPPTELSCIVEPAP